MIKIHFKQLSANKCKNQQKRNNNSSKLWVERSNRSEVTIKKPLIFKGFFFSRRFDETAKNITFLSLFYHVFVFLKKIIEKFDANHIFRSPGKTEFGKIGNQKQTNLWKHYLFLVFLIGKFGGKLGNLFSGIKKRRIRSDTPLSVFETGFSSTRLSKLYRL